MWKARGPHAAAPQRRAQDPAETPAMPGLGPRAQRPSLHPRPNLRRRDRQEEADPAPPRPLCFEAPSPVPTLGAPGVTQAQRLWEGRPPPPPPTQGRRRPAPGPSEGPARGALREAIPHGGSGAGSGAGSVSRVVGAAGRPLQVSGQQAAGSGHWLGDEGSAPPPGVAAGWAHSDHPTP